MTELEDSEQPDDSAAPEVAMDRAVAEVDPQKAPSVGKDEQIDLRLTVDVRKAELDLLHSSADVSGHSPLARFAVAKLWLAYRTMSSGKMALSLSLPSLQAEDVRPGLPDAHRSAFPHRCQDCGSVALP